MKKDAYYFSHDANAQNDEKCLYIISKFGMEGYGLYWAFIESMHETASGKLNCDLIEGFINRFNTNKEMLLQFYNEAIRIKMFVTDNEFYWSERVLKNKEIFEEKRGKRSIAGKKGMANRWAKDNNVISNDNKSITKHNKVNESKVKKSKIDKTFFKESQAFDKSYFKSCFSDWNKEKLAFYYDSLNTWSNEGNKKVDWIATARIWANRDEKQGKINFNQNKQHNHFSNGII